MNDHLSNKAAGDEYGLIAKVRVGVTLTDGEIFEIAKLCHETIAGYSRGLGEDVPSNHTWEMATDETKRSCVEGVRFVAAAFVAGLNTIAGPFDFNRGGIAEGLHNSWLSFKLKSGWTYGPKKDAANKQHPCMLPFHELSAADKFKDELFAVVAKAAITQKAKAD